MTCFKRLDIAANVNFVMELNARFRKTSRIAQRIGGGMKTGVERLEL